MLGVVCEIISEQQAQTQLSDYSTAPRCASQKREWTNNACFPDADTEMRIHVKGFLKKCSQGNCEEGRGNRDLKGKEKRPRRNGLLRTVPRSCCSVAGRSDSL